MYNTKGRGRGGAGVFLAHSLYRFTYDLLRSLIDGPHIRSINCAIKRDLRIKYQAEFESLNTIVQKVNIAHARPI